MIREMSGFQKSLSALAIASLALALFMSALWIRNQIATHEGQTRLRTAQMALLQSEGTVAGPSFPKEPVGLRLLDLTMRSARDTGLDITFVTSSPVAPAQIGGNTYQATEVSLQVTGDINQIIAFLDLLEAGAITSMTIDAIKLKWADDRWELSLDVSAYTLPG